MIPRKATSMAEQDFPENDGEKKNVSLTLSNVKYIKKIGDFLVQNLRKYIIYLRMKNHVNTVRIAN